MNSTEKRTAVITIESLTGRIEELTKRAYDHNDRFTDESDHDVQLAISIWMTVADNCVFGCCTDFDDEEGIDRLRQACEEGERAWRYLYYREPEWVIKISEDPNARYFGHERDTDNKIVPANLADCWTARTEKRAMEYADDLRNRLNLPAKVIMFSGDEMRRARDRR